MTQHGFLTPAETLELLGLYDPSKSTKPNTRYLNALSKRNLLPRFKFNGKEFKYKKTDCEKLLNKAINEGLRLT